ncbi:NAD(P)/FAD-dependent oxidoreductase [Paenibacillus lemnae]|uniref:NAD(P)/FAD-dependent oxidoreductase n=1 Tax=Paenibacillus lemnae TaxID=1330551 RepID=A0A848MCH8_PAELE|nr:FAD-dependent oxidoreductase [Paenibacillus lemnae]NMO97840.1 NAD(P)/FAD-dependent oxidoreductase [Paenibacillus lemnae]
MKKKLLLVGNGMAGVYCIEQLMKLNADMYEITIIGSDPHPPYNRIRMTSSNLGKLSEQEKEWNPYSSYTWYQEHEITLYAGHQVVHIDYAAKKVQTDKGEHFVYDILILATGSLPFMLPMPGVDKVGVIGFRDIRNLKTMLETSPIFRKAVVIGGGMLGLEAAKELMDLKLDVTVVHEHSHLMNRQLDAAAGDLLQKDLEEQGITFQLNKKCVSITGRRRAEGVRFHDGEELQADLVVMAVGIKPNVGFVRNSPLAVHRGILINDYMETSMPDVYALGECAEHRGTTYGMEAPLFEQGMLLARRLAGVDSIPYTGSVTSARINIYGVDMFSAGVISEAPGIRVVQRLDEKNRVYKKVLIQGRRVIGAVLYKDIADSTRLYQLILTGEDIGTWEDDMFFRECYNRMNLI